MAVWTNELRAARQDDTLPGCHATANIGRENIDPQMDSTDQANQWENAVFAP